jgi:hypothetical protein
MTVGRSREHSGTVDEELSETVVRLRLRTLRMGAVNYRWAAEVCNYRDITGEYFRCVRLRVWGGGKNSRVLHADLLSTSEPGPWGSATDVAYPTPRVVRAVVEYALANGWDPQAIGGRHRLDTEVELTIPGFRLTDQLRQMQHLVG